MSLFFTIRSTKRRAASRTQAGKRTILAAPRQLMTGRRSIQAAPRQLMTGRRSVQAATRQLMTDKRSVQAAPQQLFFDNRRTHIAPFTTSALHDVHSLVFYTFNAVEGAISYKGWQLTYNKGAVYYTSFILKVNDILVNSVAAPFISEYCIYVHDSLKPTTVKGAKFPTVLPPLIINTFIFPVAAPFSAVRRSVVPATALLPFRRRSVLRKICP